MFRLSFLPQSADRTLDAQPAACIGQRYAVAELHKNLLHFLYTCSSTVFPGLSRLRHNFVADFSVVRRVLVLSARVRQICRRGLSNSECLSPILGRYPQKRGNASFAMLICSYFALVRKTYERGPARNCAGPTRTGVSPKLGIPPYFTNLSEKIQIT